MSRYLVVDASVVAKWYLPETLSDRADALQQHAIAQELHLVAPDLLYYEVGNALWKRVRTQTLTAGEAQTLLAQLLALPIRRVSSYALAGAALEIAVQTGRTIYDAAYLAIAESLETRLITADERFVNALAATVYAERIEWLGTWTAA